MTDLGRRLAAEMFGTFWLVLGGCGSAVLAAKFVGPDGLNTGLGIGFLGVSLAFGLTLMTMAYAIGHISGCHINPAVTFGQWAGKRFEGRDVAPYVIAQVIGGALAATVLYVIANGQAGFSAKATGFAANGYAAHSPATTTCSPASCARWCSPPCSSWSSWGPPTGGRRRHWPRLPSASASR